MLTMETLLTFSLAALLLCISPGPSNLYIMARSLAQGSAAGISAASGMALGGLTYALATAFGLATLFKYSPMSYGILKIAGAIYLLYLGYQYWQVQAFVPANKPHVKQLDRLNIFRQSIVVELTNPKTALFFLAFLPQFVNSQSENVALQLALLGAIYVVIGFCSDLSVVMLSGQLGKWMQRYPAFVLWQDRLAGMLLIGLGCYIGLEHFIYASPV